MDSDPSSSSFTFHLSDSLPPPVTVIVSSGQLPLSASSDGASESSSTRASSSAPPNPMPPPPHPLPPVLFHQVFSPEQLLAMPPHPQPYTPMADFLGCFGSHKSTRHAHTSSKKNANYQSISEVMLTKTPLSIIALFRAVIKSMEPSISFPTLIMLPFECSEMSSEADVSSYLDAQVVISAWQVVTQMFPPTWRSYDLLSVKQLQIQDGVPYQVFGVSKVHGANGWKEFQACAILEFKSPGIVRSMITVIENKLAGRNVDQTDDWSAVTCQLRKYAVATGAIDVLVMDESTALYFRFPPNPAADDHFHEYLVASRVNIPTVATDLSMREIIAFMCWRSLLGKGAQLRDFNTSTAEASSARVEETERDGESPPPPTTHKRPHDSGGGSRVQPKRDKHNGGGTHDLAMFNRWSLNSSVTMEQLSHIPADVVRMHLPDSDLRGSSSPCPSPYQRPRCFDFHPRDYTNGRAAVTFDTTAIITETVAILTTRAGPHPCSVLAKLFAHRDSPELLAKEIAVYTACQSLQGNAIPHFYGIWLITATPAFAPIVLLTELITPGTKIASLRSAARELLADSLELERMLARLAALQETGTPAMEALHCHGVIHNDPVGRNLVVCEEEPGRDRVVVVDFHMSHVHLDSEVVERRAWQDWAFFRNAFRL